MDGHDYASAGAYFVTICAQDRAHLFRAIVGAFKSRTTVRYIEGVHQRHWPPFRGRLWQRNYYERIIRGERALNQIRGYIDANP